MVKSEPIIMKSNTKRLLLASHTDPCRRLTQYTRAWSLSSMLALLGRRQMPKVLTKFIATGVALIVAFLVTCVAAKADRFNPQILSQSGGTISISVLPNQGWHDGSITFPASNVPAGTAVYARGFAETVPPLGAPVASLATVYSIVISFDPKFATSFSTNAATTVTLTLPQNANLGKPFNMYETEFCYQTPPSPASWNGPYVGTVSSNMVRFSLPAHPLLGTTIVVLSIMQ